MAKGNHMTKRTSKPVQSRRPVLHGARIISCPHGIALMVRCAMQTALNFMDYPHCRRVVVERGRYLMLDDADKQIAEVDATEVYGWFLKVLPPDAAPPPVPAHFHPPH